MTTNELIVKMVFDRWNALLKNCDDILNSITDDRLLQELAPGKNRGIYLLGHLIAVHDDMVSLLNLGANEYAGLFEIFVQSPDRAVEAIPSAGELRSVWKMQMATLASKLQTVSVDEWFGKHNAVAEEDFINSPHRNKLNIMLTRTTHLAYHAGQLALLK